MTANTDYLLFNIIEELSKGCKVELNRQEVIGGKKYITATIGYKYKLFYNGITSHIRYKYIDTEEIIKISRYNCFFLITLCRIYSKFIEKYKIVKVDSNGSNGS